MDDKENRPLKDLVSKISHPLLEIRTRSLRSIIFKLRSNIIQSSDLLKETSLLASLLEWFNFDEWALESQVLGLLSELSQHEKAVQTLVDLGGVEFLSQLRLHCDPSLHPLIDEVLENIMMLPSDLVGMTPPGNCTIPSTTSSSNSQLTTDTTSDVGSYTPACKATVDLTENRAGEAGVLSPPPSQHPEWTGPQESGTSVPLQPSGGTNVAPSEAVMMRPHLVGTDAHCGMPAVLRPPHFMSHDRGVPQEGHPPSSPQQGSTNRANQDGGGVFPWLLLATTDHHIMATTNHRLQSLDYNKLYQCCNFIYEVLLQDYPPELFLQRPAIVHSLMSLTQHNLNHSIYVLELRCLQLLTSRLKVRLAACLQPALRVSDRLTAGRVLVGNSDDVAQGWSEDLESWSHDLENFSPEILSHLHQEQLPVSQYCSQITEHACALIVSCLNNDFQLSSGDDGSQIVQCVSSCIQLLSESALLLSQVSMNVIFMPSVLENNLLEHVNRSVECLGSALSHCLSKWRRMAQRDGTQPSPTAPTLPCTPSLVQLMVTLATVHLAYSLSTTISILPEGVSLPSAVGGALSDLVMNGLVSVCYPSLVQSLLPHVKKMAPHTYQLRTKIQSYMDSFQSMSTFLETFRAQPAAITRELLLLAEDGLLGLYFECDQDFISSTVKLCISVLVEQGELVCQTTARHVLLRLLSHGSFLVQGVALEHLHASLTSSVGGCIMDDLLENALQELCTGALLSPDESVSSLCGKVLAHLLMQGGKKALQSMVPLQLHIEAGTATSTELAMVMRNILEKEEVWSDTVKVQCLLRNMFSKSRDCRVWAFSVLSKLLIAATPGKASPFSVEQHAILHDIMILGRPSPQEQDIGQHTVFTKEDVAKLLHILRSPTMDHVLKTSAIEQLAIVLLDHSLHDSALEENVVSSVNNLVSYCLNDTPLSDHQGTGAGPIRLFKPCVRSLGLVAHSSETARRELVANKEFLLDILRGALLWHMDLELLYDVSKLLCFLLFETVTQNSQSTHGSAIKLPEGILNRLQLPFSVDAYTTESPNKLPMMLETEVFSSEPLHSVLHLAYHAFKAGGVGALLSHVCSTKEEPPLSQFEVSMLRALDANTAFRDTSCTLRGTGNQRKSTMAHLSVLELISDLSRGLELNWEEALDSLLSTHPINSSEEHMLECVLLFLCTAVTSMSSSKREWIVKAVMDPHAMCFKMMQASLQEHSERQPQKSLLKLYGNLLERSDTIPVSYIPGLVKMFCRSLDVAGSPKYYDLPLLELSLHCVLHLSRITVTMVKESDFEWLDCHMSAMAALRQVLCSFLVGRGSAGTVSFMGKGVSAKAAVALTHFLHSVKFRNPPQGWCSLWLNDPVCTGLGWLFSLLKDRDPHVQYGGFSALSLLCSEVDAAPIVLQELANCTTFGIWGECLRVGLDTRESTLVRQQAIEVVTSIVVLCSENKKWEDLLVLSLPQGGTVKGPKALRVLVDHYSLFASFKSMLPGIEHLQSLKKSCQECFSQNKAAFPAAATPLIYETLALHDPYIIWGTCQLLHNLLLPFPQYVASHVLKQGMLKHFTSILSYEVLQFIIMAYDCDLIRHEECVGSLCHMLPCLTASICSKGNGTDLCTALIALLHAMGHKASSHQLEMLFTTFQLQWGSLVGLIQHTLRDLKSLHLLAMETLRLFSLFLSASCNLSDHTHQTSSSPLSGDPVQDACLAALKELLDGTGAKRAWSSKEPASIDVEQSSPAGGAASTCGRRLCEALLRAYDELPSSLSPHTIMSALSLLVACSSTAKQAALERGFLESSIDQLQVLHKRISTEAMEQPSARREQDSPHIAELISVVNLIRNLLYKSFHSKTAALSSHLPTAIQKIWPWCCTSRRLLVSVLQLLCVFCAQHSPARATLSTGLLPSILRQITRSLGGISPTAKTLGAQGNMLRAAFTLLATAALSSECRAVMKKVGFLQSLSQLNPRAEKGSHSKIRPSCLWMKLLVNLSFSVEGQSMILKVPGTCGVEAFWVLNVVMLGSLDFLMGMYGNGSGAEQIECLLVLRNLCFHQQSKTILSTTEMVATLFSCALGSGDSQQLTLAASGIGALLFNCSKVRGSLKRSGLDKRLEQANLSYKATGFKDNPQLSHSLSTALNLLQ
ncbi:hypothetical protein EMCRGX_G031915 [Ephydatia muelleri]